MERRESEPNTSHVAQFAAIYQRVIEYGAGQTFLDVGTSLGFLPLLVAELVNGVAITACDSRQEVIACAADVAATTRSDRINFLVCDVLDPDFNHLGQFDTVAAIHLLEHFTDDQLPAALANLLEVTAHRLVVAVPYESEKQSFYGHQQVFTSTTLRRWGQWCIERLGGGRYLYEDLSGRLLVIERPGQIPADRWSAA